MLCLLGLPEEENQVCCVVSWDWPPPKASTVVVEYSCATVNEGCIRTILATLENDQRLKPLSPQETKKRTDLTILLNYIHAAQIQKYKEGATEKNEVANVKDQINVNSSHDEVSGGEQGGESNPEDFVDMHDKKVCHGTDIDGTPKATEQNDSQRKDSDSNKIEESSVKSNQENELVSTEQMRMAHETYNIDVFDPHKALKSLIEEGVLNRIFACKERMLVHLFDTGGQPEFLELLPHVLSASDSILVICFKDSESLDERYLVKYVPEDKSKHCLTTLSQLSTEEIIFQCIFSAELLSGSKFTTDKNAVFVATHIDQVKGLSENRTKIEKNIVRLDLLPRVGAENVIKQKFFRVCTERQLQLLLASFYAEDKKDVLIKKLFTADQIEWIGKMDESWNDVEVQKGSFEYVGNDESRKQELQALLGILQQYRDEKVEDLMDYSGVSKVNDILCKMISNTGESVEVSLRDFLLYLGLVHKPEYAEYDAKIEPILTLFECTQIAKSLHCIPSHITSFKEKLKAVQASLRKLESNLHLVKFSCSPSNADTEVDAINLIICDPNALYKKMSEMVCQCYLDSSDDNELRRSGVVKRTVLIDTFRGTVEGIRKAQNYRNRLKDGSQHPDAENALLTFLHDQKIISRESNGLIRVPSALRAYPTEIIPMGKTVIIPSLLLVPKGKYLPLGVLTALMTRSEKWEYDNDIVEWTLFTKEIFRNKVKYFVNGCINVTLVARPTCIEVRVEEQACQPTCDTLLFVKVHESLNNQLKSIFSERVEFSPRLVCPRHMNHIAEHLGNNTFSCKHPDPHGGSMRNCSVWFEKVRSTEEFTSIFSSPVHSNSNGTNNGEYINYFLSFFVFNLFDHSIADTKPDGEAVKLYFAESDDIKSNDEETKAHYRKMKWFKIGLLLLKGQKYDDLEDEFEKLFQENPDIGFCDVVVQKWLDAKDANWESLYRNIKFVYPSIAEKIKGNHKLLP